jgi:hypothetical protein
MNAHRLSFALSLVAAASSAFAQSVGNPTADAHRPASTQPITAQPPPAAADRVGTANSDLATRPTAAPSPSRERAVSPTLAAALAERMPRYSPPPPPREPTEEEIAASQPKNRIIRLPAVVVEEKRPPVFTERELHTRKGMAELAVSRYLSELDRGVLNRYTMPLFGQSQEKRAMEAYLEEERLRQMNTASEHERVIRASEGTDAAREFRDTTNATFIRTPYLPEPNSINRD